MNPEPTEPTNPEPEESPAPPEPEVVAKAQVEARGPAKWLSVAAIIFFVLFVVSRKLDWATFSVVVPSATNSILTNNIGIAGNEAWNGLGTPLIIFALALIPINLFFMFSENTLDPLGPAIANTVLGAALVGAMIYFIVDVNGILGGASGRKVTLTYDVASGAYVALAIAVLLLASGLWQLWLRLGDVEPDPA